MAQETLKELKYDGSKVVAECARRDEEGNRIVDTYLTDVQIISEDEIDEAFETVFGKTTTVKKFLDTTKSASRLFYEYDGTSVDDLIKYNDTSNVTDMERMFSGCNNLTTIPELDTSNVTNMSNMFCMFEECGNLTTIPESNTSNVTSTYGMFSNCSNLTSIPLLDTSSVTNMTQMFYYCSSLTTIPKLNTSKVTDMYYMFHSCSSLTTIPMLDTSNVTDMTQMFYNCSSLITIPELNTNNVTNMYSMFYNCSNLTKISMINIGTNLDISDCTKMEREALLEVLGNLKDLTGQTSKTLTLGSTLLAKLTEEDKLIATNKNWTLV